MTNEEAISNLEYLISEDCIDTHHDYIQEIEMAIEALEKQIAKKPIVMNRRTFCPRCYENKAYFPVDNWNFAINLSEIHKEEVKRLTYCKHCGQAIDWSDAE